MVSTTSSLPKTGSLDAAAIEAWLARVGQHREKKDLERIRLALGEISLLHGDERANGDMQLQLSLLQTADILDRLQLDTDTVLVGLLSEAAASKSFDPLRIKSLFGSSVLQMTRDIALIRSLSTSGGRDAGEQQSENLRRMLLGLADDVRVVLVVLAKRLQLMRVLNHMERDQQLNIAQATQRIYAPLANRLGIWQLKWELEDLSLRYSNPDAYMDIARKLEDKRDERESFIRQVIELLLDTCASHDIPAEISGRPKHIYSIWKKMHRKGVNFEQVFDVRAVRVLVDTVAHCYEVLGIVHGAWQPVPGEFDDYIARPKANGYASLHTAVVGSDGKPLEVQVRTWEMHEHAERGVAAHWRYKENRGEDRELERRIEWMRGWLEPNNDEPEDLDAADVDAEFEAKRIYVLTPQGKVVELPKGATAVDFAYSIHSSVGDRCRGAKADGRIISLTQPLQSGQSIEILTVKQGGPSRDWLNPHSGYLATARARNRIKQWFKRQDHEEHVRIGKASLEREITRLAVKRPNMEKLRVKFNFSSVDDLYAALGRGDLSPIQVANTQLEAVERDADSEIPEKALKRQSNRGPAKDSNQVVVQGVGDLMSHMAKCCKPVPYDPILGYITQGRGITIHRKDCPVVHRMNDDQKQRLVSVAWDETQPQSVFLVDIQIYASDRKGLLRDITSVFSNEEIDVLGVKTQSDRHKETASMRFTAEVNDVTQLSRLLDKLAQVPDVVDVRRQV